MVESRDETRERYGSWREGEEGERDEEEKEKEKERVGVGRVSS